jgi:Transposase
VDGAQFAAPFCKDPFIKHKIFNILFFQHGRRVKNDLHDFFCRHIFDKFQQTGAVANFKGTGRPREARSAENIDRVLEIVHQNPKTSTQRLQDMTGINRETCRRILHDEKMKPYHAAVVQQLYPEDLNLRLQFCTRMEEIIRNDVSFHQ